MSPKRYLIAALAAISALFVLWFARDTHMLAGMLVFVSPPALLAVATARGWHRAGFSAAVLALLWFGVSLTMAEPPYVSSLRIVLPEGVEATPALEQRIRACDGVSDVLLVREEHSLYVKVDSKRLTRSDLERLVSL